MASEIKVNKISPGTGTALQISDSGDTVTLPSGATLTIAGTINASTGTATGFGDNLSWQTSDIKTSTFTAAAEKGYFVNTTGGAITVNLPAGSAGTQIGLLDYAGTWDTNNCTVSANGSEKIQGGTDDVVFSRDREALQIVYVDSTQGWLITSVADQGGTVPAAYVTATGGTITTSGDYKIHTFNSSGTFTVSDAGNSSGSNTVDYMVIAGGGGAGYRLGGGGGAGGFRESVPSPAAWTGSPLANPGGSLPVSATGYPVTVGGGGTGSNRTGATCGTANTSGAASVFSTISSAGGGSGGNFEPSGTNPQVAAAGGSGGGGTGYSATSDGGAGNTPPVSPPQGSAGAVGAPNPSPASGPGNAGGGGGGASAVGQAGSYPGQPSPENGGNGGNGVTTSITASPVSYAGGGGGSGSQGNTTNGSAPFGGGTGGCTPEPSANGSTNKGGGGGARCDNSPYPKQNGGGGSGVVVIRYKYQN